MDHGRKTLFPSCTDLIAGRAARSSTAAASGSSRTGCLWFDGAGFRLVWRDALPGARHSYRSFYHRDDDCRLMVDVFAASSFDDAKRELLAGFHNCTSLVPPSVVPQLGDVSYGKSSRPRSSCAEILLVSVANAGTVEVDVRPFAVALDEKVSDCLH